MASRKSADALPPVPPSLKAVSPFLQRAEELRTKDPIMAYWCTYYAAQLGLDIKSHEPGAREFLLSLITLLENSKADIGANDAVDNEAAGAAYVENFAVKVFSLADNEDRRGEATRATAKKFLAAANFLELLKVFEKTNNAQVNEEKIRYAKWKATEIAKAIREGRKPSPGAVDEHLRDSTVESSPKSAPSTMDSSSIATPSDHPVDIPPVISVDASNIPHTPPRKLKPIYPTIDVPSPDVHSPGTWSTVATPGSDAPGLPSASTNLAFASAMNRLRGVDGSDESPLKAKGGLAPQVPPEFPPKKVVHFSPSVVGGTSTDGSAPVSPEAGSRTFTSRTAVPPPTLQIPTVPQGPSGSGRGSREPTVTPLPDSPPSDSSPTGRSREGASPTSVGSNKKAGSPARESRLSSSPPSVGGTNLSSSPPRATDPVQPSAPPFAPTFATPSAPPVPPSSNGSRGHERRTSLTSRSSPPQQANSASYPTPPPPSMPPANASFSSTSTYVSAPIPSSDLSTSTGSAGGQTGIGSVPKPVAKSTNDPPALYNPYGVARAPAPPPPSPPFELTTSIIAKVQKHCRYAISSLEYEDADEARKQLRAALAALGEPQNIS